MSYSNTVCADGSQKIKMKTINQDIISEDIFSTLQPFGTWHIQNGEHNIITKEPPPSQRPGIKISLAANKKNLSFIKHPHVAAIRIQNPIQIRTEIINPPNVNKLILQLRLIPARLDDPNTLTRVCDKHKELKLISDDEKQNPIELMLGGANVTGVRGGSDGWLIRINPAQADASFKILINCSDSCLRQTNPTPGRKRSPTAIRESNLLFVVFAGDLGNPISADMVAIWPKSTIYAYDHDGFHVKREWYHGLTPYPPGYKNSTARYKLLKKIKGNRFKKIKQKQQEPNDKLALESSKGSLKTSNLCYNHTPDSSVLESNLSPKLPTTPGRSPTASISPVPSPDPITGSPPFSFPLSFDTCPTPLYTNLSDNIFSDTWKHPKSEQINAEQDSISMADNPLLMLNTPQYLPEDNTYDNIKFV